MLLAFSAALFGAGIQDSKTAGGLAFDVVSVKPKGDKVPVQLPDGRWTLNIVPLRYTPGRVTWTNSLDVFIEHAYSLSDWELEGPSWIHSLIYELEAKFPPETNMATARLMFRTMLAERFGLQFHWESRKTPGYVVSVGKDGFKLEPTTPESGSTWMSAGLFRFSGPAEGLVGACLNYTDHPMVDKTGLAGGFYKLELRWEPTDPHAAGRHYEPGFWTALERATGLKMEKQTLEIRVLVVDHAERVPTPN